MTCMAEPLHWSCSSTRPINGVRDVSRLHFLGLYVGRALANLISAEYRPAVPYNDLIKLVGRETERRSVNNGEISRLYFFNRGI